jgi:hypothetical protein
VIERVTPVANSNANASHMMVCFIVAFPRPIKEKIRRIPRVRERRHQQLQNQFGLVRGQLMALEGRPRGKRLAVETRLRAAWWHGEHLDTLGMQGGWPKA